MYEWQPMETAPKDGRDILVLIMHSEGEFKFYDNQLMKWHNNDWKIFCAHGNKSSNGTPAYWLPIPGAPKETQIKD